MLKLGIIGTSWISHEFITAAHQTGHYHLQSVYSRKDEEQLKIFVSLMERSLATRISSTS